MQAEAPRSRQAASGVSRSSEFLWEKYAGRQASFQIVHAREKLFGMGAIKNASELTPAIILSVGQQTLEGAAHKVSDSRTKLLLNYQRPEAVPQGLTKL